MTLIPQRERSDMPHLEPVFKGVEGAMGFVPNSMLTMAHWEELLGHG